MGVLHGRHGDVAPFHPGVGAALDEVHARHRRQAHQVVEGEHFGRLQQRVVRAIDHQAVLRRVNVVPALMVALEMQASRGDDAEHALQRRERHRGSGDARQAGGLAALQVFFKLRRHAIWIGGDRLAEGDGVWLGFEDGFVA